MLLLLLLIAAGEAAYFETTVQQQTADAFQQQESDWQKQDDMLRAENKQMTSAKGTLARAIAATDDEVKNLTDQLQKEKAADAAEMAAKAAAPVAPAPGTATASSQGGDETTSQSNSLGTIATLTGQTFQNCQLLKVEADGITFSHSEGITKVLYPDLPPALQKRFAAQAQAQ